MTTSPGPGPVTIPPPRTVRVAAALVALEGVGLLVLAALTARSGIAHHARGVQLGAEVAYYVVVGVALVLVAAGLLRGRRWARTPAIVVQVIVIGIGFWIAFPSAQVGWGLASVAVGAVTLALLVTRPANQWIKRFPRPFGLDEGR